MLAEAKAEGLDKTLGVWDLIILGIGAIIGSGILLLSESRQQAAAQKASAQVLRLLFQW